jgi:hypothetical protein
MLGNVEKVNPESKGLFVERADRRANGESGYLLREGLPAIPRLNHSHLARRAIAFV